jgi:hypothetical protein
VLGPRNLLPVLAGSLTVAALSRVYAARLAALESQWRVLLHG